jgi:predicted ArsR family transcriptional regulator
MQLALTLDEPRARRRDPSTSKQAAFRAREFQATHAERVLASLKKHGPMTVDEIANLSGLNTQQINKRLPELQRIGAAAPTGHERPSASGRLERVWAAA